MRLSVLIFTFISSSFALDCPSNWVLYAMENVCIIYQIGSFSWESAERRCEEIDGKLVTISNLKKNAFVMEKRENSQFSYWLGIRWNDLKRNYLSINGSVLDTSEAGFPPWRVIDEDDDKSAPEAPMHFCVRMNKEEDGWATGNCSKPGSYICEKPMLWRSRNRPIDVPVTKTKQDSDNNPVCGPTWIYYSKENSCLKLINNPMGWKLSRSTCQTQNSDLARVYTKDKLIFLSEQARQAYWVGAANFRRTRSHQGGATNNIRSIYDDTPARSNCPAVSGIHVNTRSCYQEMPSFCEIFPQKKVPEETHCTYDYCICKKKHWWYFKGRNVFITINWAVHNFTYSDWICQHLGGQPLTIADVGTARFVKNLKVRQRPGSTAFWIGLTVNEQHDFEWIDETPWRIMSFQNWTERTSEDKRCVSVMTDPGASWSAMSCESELFSFCESSEPCAPRLTMHFNGQRVTVFTNIMFRAVRNVSVNCSVDGYPHRVATLFAYCGQDSEYYAHGRVSVDITILITPSLHGQFCGCDLKLDDGTEKKASTRIIFLTPPQMVNKGNLTDTYEITKDNFVSFHFEIYSNPAPKNILLVWDEGAALDKDQYRIAVLPSDQAAKYTVNVVLHDHNFELHYAGYDVTVDNGVGNPLTIKFIIEARAIQAIVGETEEAAVQWTLLFNIVGACSVVILVLACYETSETLTRVPDEKDQRLYPEQRANRNNRTMMEGHARLVRKVRPSPGNTVLREDQSRVDDDNHTSTPPPTTMMMMSLDSA